MLPFKPLAEYGVETRGLGHGTYGYVYATSKGYAIKEMKVEDTHQDPSFLISAAAIREIVSLLVVKSPYVLPIIDVDLGKKKTSLVLPMAETSFDRIIEDLNVDAQKILQRICLGVADIHNSNLLHLDLKPENVLIAQDQTWVADLGLSKLHSCSFPPLQGRYGTQYYRAPEIILEGPITEKADVWAVGVIIAETILSRYYGKRKHLFEGTSELDQILEIFRVLGTPSSGEIIELPMWSRMRIRDYDSTLEDEEAFTDQDLEFIRWILNPNYLQRPSIFEVLVHPYLGYTGPSKIELTCNQKLELYSHYPSNKWKFWQKRIKSIDWMYQLWKRYRLLPEVLSLGVYLMDRYVTYGTIKKGQQYLVICGCFYLAASFYQNHVVFGVSLPGLASNTFTLEQLVEMTNKILTKTSFDLAPVTSYLYLSRYLLSHEDLTDQSEMIWLVSLVLPVHFTFPEEVSIGIISLVNEDPNSVGLTLISEYKNIDTSLKIYQETTEIMDRLIK